MSADQVGLFDEMDREARIREVGEWGAWDLGGHPTEPAGDGCQATVESRLLGAYSGESHPEYRGACLGCAWRGPIVDDEDRACEDAHDHAWPGWRDLPTAQAITPKAGMGDRKALLRWVQTESARLLPLYPPGWPERGGAPILTERGEYGHRHVPRRSPWGGYDMAAVAR